MNFILISGPPAVGKMTVGQELSRRLNYPLLHNHHSIELALDLFSWETPEFKRINSGIRELVFDTVADSTRLRGFIFTLVIAFDLEKDVAEVRKIFARFQEKGWTPLLVELYAPLSKRLERNPTANRLAHKPSKRKLELSENNLHDMEARYQMSIAENEPQPFPEAGYLRLDNSELSAAAAAARIIEHFDL